MMPSVPENKSRNLFRRLLSDRRANFAVMTALSAPVAIALCAVAIDEGSLYTERRSAQALVDIAAITAAANIDNANAAVLLTLKDNGLPSAVIEKPGEAPGPGKAVVSVTPGTYSAASSLGTRFEAGKHPYNAVRVSLRKLGTLHFGGALMAPPEIGTTAVASVSPQAAFSIGSRLASVDTKSSPILDAVLGGLLGTSLSLNVMDYKALVAADINVLSFIDALAVRLKLTGVTYDDVLASEASIGQMARAMADLPGLKSTSRLALQTIALKAAGAGKIGLRSLIDLGPAGRLGVGQSAGQLPIVANALSMLTASAVLADGKHQVDVDLGANVPDLLSTRLTIAIGEPEQHSPWFAVGEKGAVVRTAQTRIRLVVGVGGLESLVGKIVTLPLYVDIAYAKGELGDITCSAGRVAEVKVDATPGVVDLRIAAVDSASMNDFSRPPAFSPAKLVDVSLGLSLVSVSAQARAAVENRKATSLHFSESEIDKRAIKGVSTDDFTSSLVAALFGSLHLEARVLGLKVSIPKGFTEALEPTLGKATTPIGALLDNLLALLGAKIGDADIRVTGATCGRSLLVQ